MKNKLVIWGVNAQDEKVLVAMELQVSSNKVTTYLFPETIATDEFYQQLMDQWRNDQPVDFPEGYTRSEQELTMTDTLLPESIKVERGDLIQRAQTEWHYMVLSGKLSQSYQAELDEMEEKTNKLDRFDEEVWDALKNFWEKVQNQVRERTLLREHADELRERTNEAFNKLKQLRSRMDETFRQKSRENVDRFFSTLDEVEKKLSENTHLSKLFDELKDLQQKFRSAEFTRDHRGKVWQRLDNAFKAVKEKRFGGSSNAAGEAAATDRAGNPVDRTSRRYEGLMGAIEKMERSIERDEADLNFQKKKVANTDGQLEAQIRQAKIQMVEQRIQSKREKLTEMHQTRQQLEERMEKIRERESKQQERERIAEAKEAAKEKIAGEIRAQQAALADEAPKLEKAAHAITNPVAETTSVEEPTVAPAPEATPESPADEVAAPEAAAPLEEAASSDDHDDSLLNAIGVTLSESLEDMVDTVKAVASVVGEKIEDAYEDLKEDLMGDNDEEDSKPETTPAEAGDLSAQVQNPADESDATTTDTEKQP